MDKGFGSKEGYEAECKAFGELAMTKESRGLIGLFQSQTECKKNRFGKPQRQTKYNSNATFFYSVALFLHDRYYL